MSAARPITAQDQPVFPCWLWIGPPIDGLSFAVGWLFYPRKMETSLTQRATHWHLYQPEAPEPIGEAGAQAAPEHDDRPIGPNSCPYCSGEYGEHSKDCSRNAKATSPTPAGATSLFEDCAAIVRAQYPRLLREPTDKEKLLAYLDTIARMTHPPMNTPEGARECDDWDIRLRALIERARGNAERFL